MKIKISFHTTKYGTITNDKLFVNNDDMAEDEYGGCIIEFKKVPMLQDYNTAINELWCRQLQWNYPDGKIESITTKLLTN